MARKTYLDSSQAVQVRVKDLARRMTLKEKVGQMTGSLILNLEGAKEEIKSYCIGAGAPYYAWISNGPKDMVDFANSVQKFAVEKSRLRIPILFYLDAVHGHAFVKGATIFPHNLGLAATWDSGLVTRVSTVTAREVRATGVHQTFSPICDIAREPRWGRTYETFGESPHLCAVMSAAKVIGYQGNDGIKIDEDRVIATAKHFPAYSCPERGQDASPVDISEYTFRMIHLPSFKSAIEAGALSIMPCYNEINGKPVHGSEEYLSDLLRKELGFKGIVVSDAGGIDMLHEYHHTAETYEEAVRQGVEAGIDIDLFSGSKFASALFKLVENNEISERRIDESISRILEVKFRLGLFDNPYANPEGVLSLVGCEAHRKTALLAARKSMTLLKNENDLLPLRKDVETILVTGPNADNVENQLGGWSNATPPFPSAVTILKGIMRKVSPKTKVLYTLGSGISEHLNIGEAKDLAEESDVAIVAVGESAYVHEFWTLEDLLDSTSLTREKEQKLIARLEQFPSRTSLDLPQAQLDLIRAIHETETPIVVVLVTGRPLSIRWIAEHVPAILMAYLPGSEGGTAVADVLFGDCNPGGRLPISIARSIGQLPIRHNHKPYPFVERHPPAYVPLFEFGFGLSYTVFKYSDLNVLPNKIDPCGEVEVSITVTNVGEKSGEDVVQLYINDVYSSRVTPSKELKDFKRVALDQGESRRVKFTLMMKDLGVLQDNGELVTEPGAFEVIVGDLKSKFEVIAQPL